MVIALPERLGEAALVNAIATATEAKTQALWDVGVSGTGTATDALCILCPSDEQASPCLRRSRVRPGGRRLARAVHRAVLVRLHSTGRPHDHPSFWEVLVPASPLYAERLMERRPPPVTYVATLQMGDDPDLLARVERHSAAPTPGELAHRGGGTSIWPSLLRRRRRGRSSSTRWDRGWRAHRRTAPSPSMVRPRSAVPLVSASAGRDNCGGVGGSSAWASILPLRWAETSAVTLWAPSTRPWPRWRTRCSWSWPAEAAAASTRNLDVRAAAGLPHALFPELARLRHAGGSALVSPGRGASRASALGGLWWATAQNPGRCRWPRPSWWRRTSG